MSERVLIPLDGSKMGEASLSYVEELVSRLALGKKVEVTLFQVASSLTHWVVAGEASAPVPYNERELKQVEKEALEYLDKASAGLRSKGAIVKIKVAIGNAAEEIIKAEEEINADLVAMSTHGRSGLSRWAFGSVTDKVLRGGRVPVLLVRAEEKTAKT